jgi:hypothetical protein
MLPLIWDDFVRHILFSLLPLKWGLFFCQILCQRLYFVNRNFRDSGVARLLCFLCYFSQLQLKIEVNVAYNQFV